MSFPVIFIFEQKEQFSSDQLWSQRCLSPSVLILFSSILHKRKDCGTHSIRCIAFLQGPSQGITSYFPDYFLSPPLPPEFPSIYINQNIFTQSPPPLQQI